MRIAQRSNIMMVEGQVYGSEGKARADDMIFSTCIQLGSFNSGDYHEEDELAAWYAQWRLPHSMGTLSGMRPGPEAGVDLRLGQACLPVRIHLAGGA